MQTHITIKGTWLGNSGGLLSMHMPKLLCEKNSIGFNNLRSPTSHIKVDFIVNGFRYSLAEFKKNC